MGARRWCPVWRILSWWRWMPPGKRHRGGPCRRTGNLRPIADPELKRTICLAIRKDYIHESLLNVVIRAIKSIIPATLLTPVMREEYLRL